MRSFRRSLPSRKPCMLYRRWYRMRARCNYKRDICYSSYGGRGIKACQEWDSYPTFRAWAIANGFRKELTIDRIDSNGNYCPENCRWVTMAENLANRCMRKGAQCKWAKLSEADVIRIKCRISNGESLAMMARDFNVSHSAISRIKRGLAWKHV